MKEYTPGQGSYKVEEGGALSGIPTSYDVDTHFGSLTLRRDDISIPARGVGFNLGLKFNSDHLYSTVMPIVSKSDGPGGTGIPISPSLMTLPGNQTNFYRFANGWSWDLPFLLTGAKADGSPQTAAGGGTSPGWNLFKYCSGGRIFDLLPALSQEAWNDGKGFHTWTEGYEVTYKAEVTALGGNTLSNGSGSLGYNQVTVVIPEVQQVITGWVIRSGSAAPFDFTPSMTIGFTPVVFLSDGKVLRFGVKGLLVSISDAANINSVTYSYTPNKDVLIGSVPVSTTSRKTFSLATQADFDACSVGDLIVLNDEIKVILAKPGATTVGNYTVTTSSNFDITVSAGSQYTIVKGQLQMMAHTDGRAVKFYYLPSGLTSTVVTLLSSDQTYNNFNNGDQILGVYSINAVNQLWRFQAVNSLAPGSTTTFPSQLAANPSTYYSPLQQMTYSYQLTLDPRPDSDKITVVNHAGAATVYYFQSGGFCTHSWNNAFFHTGACRRGGTATLLNIERPDFYIGSLYNYMSINRIDQRAFYSASKADYQKDARAAEFQEDTKYASEGQKKKVGEDAWAATNAPAVSSWQLVTKQLTSNRVQLSAALSVPPLQNDIYGCVQLTGPYDMSLRVNASSQDTTKIYIDYKNDNVGTPLKANDYIFIRGYMAQIQAVGTDTWGNASQNYVLTTDPLPFSAAEGEYVIAVYLAGGKIPTPQTHYGYYLNKPKCVRVELKGSLAATLQRWKRVDYHYTYNIQGMEQSDTFDQGGFDLSQVEGPQPSSFALSDIKLKTTTVTTSEASASSERNLFQDVYSFAYDAKGFHQGTDAETRTRFDPASLSWLFVKTTTKVLGRPCFNAGYWGTVSEARYEGGDVTNVNNGGMNPRQSISYRFDVYGRTVNERTVSDSFESRKIRNRWFQYCCTSQDRNGKAANWDLDPRHQFAANYFSNEYGPLMDTFHALGVVAASIEEVDAQQTQSLVMRKFDPVFFNLLVEDRVVVPMLTNYLDTYSVNSPNWVASLGGTMVSSPSNLRWSTDGSTFNANLGLLRIGEGALNAHALTTFAYDVGAGTNNTNQLLTITKPMGNVSTLTYGTGWASSYIAADSRVLANNLGGTTQYIVNLYSYDVKGRLTAKTTVLSTDAAGTLPYGYASSASKTKGEYTYDGLNRVLTQTVGDGTTQTLSRRVTYLDDGDGAHEGPYAIETDYLGFRTKTLYDSRYRVVAKKRFKPSKGVAGVTTYANSLVVNGLCNQPSPPALKGQTPAATGSGTFTQSFTFGSAEGVTGSAYCLVKTSAAGSGTALAYLGSSSTSSLSGLVIGRSYRMAAWVYVPTQTLASFNNLSFGWRSYKSGAWTYTSVKPTAQWETWQQIETTFTVPSGITGLGLYFSINATEQPGTLFAISDIEVQDITVAAEVAIASESCFYNEGLDLVVQSTRYSTAAESASQSVDTQYTYDSIGRLLQVASRTTDPTYQGDSVYHTVKQIRYDDRLNGTVTLDYADDNAIDSIRTDVYRDWLGRGPIKTVSYTGLGGTGLARTTTNHYRHDGKLTQTTMPNDESYYYQYDNLGKLEKVAYPDGTETSSLYDLNGNLVQTIDRRNLSVSMEYNAADLEVSRTVLDGNTGPWPSRGSLVTKTLYTQLGPAQITTTENGLPVVQESLQYHFSGGVTLRQQRVTESAGLPAAVAATALVVGTQYTIASAGTDFTAVGATSNAVGTIFTATGVGTGTGTAFLTVALQMAYGYDAVGNAVSMTPSGSGPSPWTNTFTLVPLFFPTGSDTSNFNRMSIIDTSTNQSVVTARRDFLGLPASYKYGTYATPAGQLNYQYDQLLRLRSLVSTESTPALNLTLTRDFLGNLLTQNEPAIDAVPAVSNSYTYDGMKRLVASEGTTEAYDDMSNLIAKNGAAYTYQDPAQPRSDQMRLAKYINGANTYVYAYDSNGNPTSVSQNTAWRFSSLAYDNANRLRQIVSSKTDNYWYNHIGLRVKKTEDAAGAWLTTYTLFAGNNPLLQETYNAAGRIQTTFNLIVDDKILAQYKKVYPSTTSKMFFYVDHLNSRRVVFNSTPAVIDRYRYSAWGVVTQDLGTDALASYTGKDYDATGLIYFNARYYDPLTGRFLTEDPSRKGGNWYSYCENNPVNYTDPSGLMTAEEMTAYYAQQSGNNIHVDNSGQVTTTSRSSYDQSSSLTNATVATHKESEIAAQKAADLAARSSASQFLNGVATTSSAVAIGFGLASIAGVDAPITGPAALTMAGLSAAAGSLATIADSVSLLLTQSVSNILGVGLDFVGLGLGQPALVRGMHPYLVYGEGLLLTAMGQGSVQDSTTQFLKDNTKQYPEY